MEHPKKIIAASMVLTIFVLVVSLAALYAQAQIEAGTVCTCVIPLPVLVPMLSSIGLLVGTLIYYMFYPSSEQKPKPLDTKIILDFLGNEEAEIVRKILENRGEISQARIVSSTGLPKVKVFRIIERLKNKGIVSKEPYGKTNIIKIREDIRKLFVQ
ncbi:MAG: hypothetical protein KAW40_06185 [Candidatus Aenigmarchaeota archaeon]|nr:hypothetical protein [Candidatus Aenigmarchaeota archaeon]